MKGVEWRWCCSNNGIASGQRSHMRMKFYAHHWEPLFVKMKCDSSSSLSSNRERNHALTLQYLSALNASDEKLGGGLGMRLRSAISALKYRGTSTCKHYMQCFWHHIFAATFHSTLQDHKPCLPQHYTKSTLSVTCETGTHELACTIHSPSVRSRVCKSNPQVSRNCPTNLKSEKIMQWWS